MKGPAIAFVICAALTIPSRSILAGGDAAAAAPFRREVRGITLEVLPTDLTLTRVGEPRPFFSLGAFESERLRRDLEDGGTPGDARGCVRTIDVLPLAWTGDLLSVRETSETVCPREAHPAGESRFVTFAVSAGEGQGTDKTGETKVRSVALTEWVPAAAVFTALRRDALVRAALASSSSSPTTLGELVTEAAESPPALAPETKCHVFPENLLERFAPSHVENGRLAVRLALPGAAVCRTRLTELGIVVPLPPALRPSLTAAAAGRGGFLKRNAPRALAKRPTRIELRP